MNEFERNPNQKFQAVIVRFQDHVEMLRGLTRIDLQLLFGYMTLEFAFGSWLVKNPLEDTATRIGLIGLNSTLFFMAIKLMYNNYRRRSEVVSSLKNVLDYLGFRSEGVYLKNKALDAESKYRPWWWWYVIGCFVTYLSTSYIIFIPIITRQ